MSVSSNTLKEKSRNLLQEEDTFYDELEPLMDNDDDDDFPTTSGIRVLLVDADPNSSLLMKNLMTQFSYEVTYYENGEDAIAFLKKKKKPEIDLVLWDYHMPKINGLEALKTIGKETDLPVVIISCDHKRDIVKKSTLFGACDFLVKPVSKEVIAVLWRHVFNKKMNSKPDLGKFVGSNSGGFIGQEDNDDLCQSNEEGSKNVEDSVEHNTSDQLGDKSSSKKRRMSWTPELHQKFEVAVEKLISLEKVYPKHILKCMQEELNVEGLTRNNVASHLQKYRLNAVKKNNVPQETHEDSAWRNTLPNTPIPASKPLLNTNINFQTGLGYFMNDQTVVNAPIQYPSNGYLTMNNNHFMNNAFANGPNYIDPFYKPGQQQQHQQYYPSLQFPPVISKEELGHVSSAMENLDLISYPELAFDVPERFPPGYNNFDPNARY